jgi:mono/diheme cytochrome c family protein
MRTPSAWLPSAVALLALTGAGLARADEGVEFFEKRVRPVLVDHCYKCHSDGQKVKGELRLDTRAGTLKGGKAGPAVVPREPDKSLLIQAVRYGNPDLQMPPKEKLSDAQIADLVAWVKMGAPDPRGAPEVGGVATEAARPPGADVAAARQKFPYTPVRVPAVPEVKNTEWSRNALDRFVLAKLEEKGLKPAAPADKRTLIRRATFDLTGLPPTVAEVEAFLADASADAFAKVVDRLLASPAYGQRYARHWLDLVRYTDSFDARGTGGPMDCAEAWQYRDWVVDAFNRDLAYDAFVRQQIAGDVLPDVDRAQGTIATGVYAIGNWGGGDADKEKLLTDIVDDQVDLTGRAFLGLTLACARCHDHKFDPVSTEDYYGLAGIFFSSHILPDVGPKTNGPNMLRIPLAAPEELARREKLKAELAALEKRPAANTYPLASFKPFTEVLRGIHGVAGLHALKPVGSADTPSATFNTTDREAAFVTIKMPARSIAVHPPPRGGVALVFTAPHSAAGVTVTASLADADPNCGDGFDYRLLHRRGDVATPLHAEAVKNGKGVNSPAKTIDLAHGDRVELLVLPKAEYSCDTTVIDLKIAYKGQVWSAREDFLALETLVNPAPDLFNNQGVWQFVALTDDPRIAAIKSELGKPLPATHGLQEGGVPGSPHAGVHDVKVHIRGRYDRLGPTVPRRFPRVLAGESQSPITTGSGRLDLARWVASAENPLTARVMVNRLWQWHFGEGIVRTPNNFGHLGTPPTHPELLDWLAAEFVRSGWSVKAMHRTIMLSAAYGQASSAEAATVRADPENLLVGRMNRRRLDAEQLRDSMLAATGELTAAAGGPAVKDLNSPRRTLYLMTIRSDRTGFRMLFDAADPTAIIDKRTDSTVAPQALFLMNHPFVAARAKALAGEAGKGQGADGERVRMLYERLFGRPATEEEVRLALDFLGRKGGRGWEAYCHALLCANEFAYVD